MSFFDPENDICECGHRRRAHDADGDFDGERWRGYWLNCSFCECEEFEEAETPVDREARLVDRAWERSRED